MSPEESRRSEALVGELEILRARVKELEAAEGLRRAGEYRSRHREAHLKQVLLAIRNVNQLIVAENDPEPLIERACATLTGTLGYHNAWIALLNKEDSSVILTASSGFDGEFSPMEERLQRGEFSSCMKRALKGDGLEVIEDPPSRCKDCPLAHQYAGRAGLTHRLSFGERLYGILSVSVPAAYAHDAEEQELFRELAGDLGFALHKIESEEQLQRLAHVVATLPQPMAFLSKDYRHLAVNDVYAQLYDTPREKILGREVADFCGKSFFQSDVKSWLDRCLAGEPVQYEVRVDFPGKGDRWMRMEHFPYRDERGEIAGAVTHGLDITEAKLAEDALRESEERFRQVYEHMAVGVARVSMDFRIQNANEAYCRMLGYREEELIGKHLKDITHPETVEENLLKQSRLAEGEIDHYRMDKRFIHKSGRTVHGILDANLVRDARGAPLYFLGSVLDITERKRAEEDLDRLNAELRRKNAELEQVVYVASHDLRSPLVNIDGYGRELEYALEDLRRILSEAFGLEIPPTAIPLLDEDIPEALRFIRTSASKMDTLLTGLLRLSRSGRATLSMKPLDMNKLVSKVLDSMEFQMKEAGVVLEVADLPPCRSDAVQVSQVFSNLLSNALKYLDPRRPGIIGISGRIQGDRSEYCVEDNGIGIAPAHLDKIFEIFHRLDPAKGEGEGLGLTIVKRILDRLDGSVRVESAVDGGSRFYAALPKVRSI